MTNISTDEIIKRLERCVKRGNRNYNTDIVLDLINRQKAEIERLYKRVEELSDVLSNTIKIRYAEAYKDFAEHLKEEWFNNYYDSPDVNFDEFVDNSLKEMLGEE